VNVLRHYRNACTNEIATLEYAPAALDTHAPRHLVRASRTGRVCEWAADSIEDARRWWGRVRADLVAQGFRAEVK
jgi:hypothetical protein